MSYPGVLPACYIHHPLPLKGFKASAIEPGHPAAPAYERRDCYKICLITGKGRMYYQGEEMVIDESILFYAGPNATYFWESLAQDQTWYRCLFTGEFLSRHPGLTIFLQSPIIGLGEIALCPLNREQQRRLVAIFGQILSAQESDYIFKHELISNYLHVLIHEALKMQPSENG